MFLKTAYFNVDPNAYNGIFTGLLSGIQIYDIDKQDKFSFTSSILVLGRYNYVTVIENIERYIKPKMKYVPSTFLVSKTRFTKLEITLLRL